MKPKRVVLFSGMGGDDRLFRSIRIPEAEIVTPDHTEPAHGETLTQYASRVADDLDIQPAYIIGGVSFGGMLAGEIARQRPVAGLILLGSCLRPSRLPWSYRWLERLGHFIPDFVLGLRSWPPLVRWRFAPLTHDAETCLIEMASCYPAEQLREFGRMVIDWPGVDNIPCPVLFHPRRMGSDNPSEMRRTGCDPQRRRACFHTYPCRPNQFSDSGFSADSC